MEKRVSGALEFGSMIPFSRNVRGEEGTGVPGRNPFGSEAPVGAGLTVRPMCSGALGAAWLGLPYWI